MNTAGTSDIGPMIKTVSIAILATLLAAGIWFYLLQKKAMQEEVRKDLSAIAHLQYEHIKAWHKDHLNHSKLKGNPSLTDRVTQFIADPSTRHRQDILQSFRDIALRYDYADILLVDPEGTELVSLAGNARRLTGYEPVLPTVLRKGRPVLIDLPAGKAHQPCIATVTPIFSDAQKRSRPLGALILITNPPKDLCHIFQSWPTPSKTAETLLVRRDGEHVIFLSNLCHHPASGPDLRIPLHRTEAPAVMAVLGEEGFVQGTDYRGVKVAAVIRKVEDSNWFMLAKIDIAEAYADWRFRASLLLALIVGSVTLMAVTGLLLWQRASKRYFQNLYRSEAALRASKERHSIILKAIGDAVIATAADGRVELLNPVAEAMTGWTQEEAKGKALDEVFCIVNAETREKAEDPVAKVMREGVVVGLANHTVLIAKDGTEYQIADSAAPIKDTDGALSGVVLVFRNVTKEYRMREELTASERYYRSLIHSLHEDILVIDRDYRITDINNSALRTLGFSREKAIGRHCYDVSHGLDSPCDENTGKRDGCGLLQVFEKGEVCSFHHKHINKSGQPRHIDLLCSPLRDMNGRIIQMVEAVRDVTDLFAAQEALAESEEKFRSLFNNAPLPYMSLDENGSLVDVNPAWLETLGYSKKDALGKSVEAFLHAGIHKRFKACFKEFKRSGQCCGVELRLKHGKGHYIDVSFTGRIPNHQGDGFLQAYCVFEDITDRKQAEENLRRLISAINHTTEAIIITDIEGSIQYINPAFEHVTGYSVEEVLGQNPRFLNSGKQDKAFYRQMWQTILSGETWRGRITNRRKDGALYTEENVISPVLNNAGDAVNFVAVKRDISDEIQMEEKLRQSQKMEAIGALAGGIAHDFNNILFPIIGMSELLLQDLRPKSTEYENVREIQKAGKRGSELIQQILSFSRQSDGKQIPTRLQRIVKEVIKLARSTIPSNIAISHRIQPDCGLVMADPIQIHQIAMNLITNAYHAVEHNHGSILIHLKEICLASGDLIGRPILPGRYALLTVSDTGSGIDPAVKDKIFEPYFTTKVQGKGTGLGLSTVYGIINRHNGDITVYSEMGKGTTFKVYLPLMAKADSSEPLAPPESLLFGNERIFLVDDDAAIVEIEKQMLERLGYQVTTRASSLDALEAFKADPDAYDLIISDMTMPNMTGVQLTKAILAIRKDIPVIICTGYSEWINPEIAGTMGIKGLLMKPVAISEMAKMVRKVLD